MPKKMVAGLALGLFGGIAGLAFMVDAWSGSMDSVTDVALIMLVSMMFFAVAGTFTSYSPVKGTTMAVLAALPAAFTIIAYLNESLTLWSAVLLVIVGLAALLCAACPSVRSWVDINRRV